MPKLVYPKEMTVTEEGKILYGMWRRVRNNTDEFGPFANYPDFYNWAMDNYFRVGMKFRRFDETLPYSPENCTFIPADTENRSLNIEQRRMVNRWNRTVNVIRAACGLKPFDVYDEDAVENCNTVPTKTVRDKDVPKV